MTRLPVLPASIDCGYIYVAQRGEAYKIGFSRRNPSLRARTVKAKLILTIRAGDRPNVLERVIHKRFAHKRVDSPGSKREWFALDVEDLAWLRGFSLFQARDSLTLSI